MVIVDSDLKILKSANSALGIDSLGAEMIEIEASENLNSLWDNVQNTELSSTVVGEYEVRCVYVANKCPNDEAMKQMQVWIEQNTASPFTDIDIGVGTAAIGDVEQSVTDENTLPSNIFWTFARGEENAQLLGDIGKNQGKSLWIRRHAGPAKSGSSYPSDNYILRFKFLKSAGGGGVGPPPPTGDDPFGLRMIYETNGSPSVSAPFYMNMTDPYSDCRFDTSTGNVATRNADGSWSLGGSIRIRLFTSVGGCARSVIYDTTLDTYDHDIWGERGYMYAPNDWKNVEITGYYKIVAVNPDNTTERKLYEYSRGLRHNTNVGGGCSGTAYKASIYTTQGLLKWHKESFHDGSQPCGDRNIQTFKENIGSYDTDQWFGMKTMIWNYTSPDTGLKNVHLELWLDPTGTNNWIKQGERNDTGGWYPGAPDVNCPGDENCGGHQDQIIHWGGPITEIRWDGGY